LRPPAKRFKSGTTSAGVLAGKTNS
jgi:hypothetical protein